MSDDEKVFEEPQRVAINRVYTRKGDSGHTSLVGGQKVLKSSQRITTYGTVDELMAFVGVAYESCRTTPMLAQLTSDLRVVQHQLFNLGSILATLPEDVHPAQARVREEDIAWLEAEMDRANAELEPLRSFVLPGGSRLNAELHVCRTVCRRAERELVVLSGDEEVDPVSLRYLNRLSDAFFVWSRWAVLVTGAEETLWDPNLGVAKSED